MMNGAQYVESLKKLKPRIFYRGERWRTRTTIPRSRPTSGPRRRRTTWRRAAARRDHDGDVEPRRGEDLPLHPPLLERGRPDQEDRHAAVHRRETGTCFQRCVGLDAINALWSVTYDIDQAKGTDYQKRFRKYLARLQREDLMSAGAMTDSKGDRSLAPWQQADPDLYVRIVERRPDGIVIRGAKTHITGAANSHEIIVMPTLGLPRRGPTTRSPVPCRSTPRGFRSSSAVRATTNGKRRQERSTAERSGGWSAGRAR